MSNQNPSRTLRVTILAFGEIVGVIAQIATAATLARILTRMQYSIYLQSLLVFGSFSPILNLGLPNTIYILLPRAPQRTRAILLENQLLLGVIGIISALSLYLGGAEMLARSFHNQDLAVGLLYLAPYFAFMLPLSSFNSVLLVNNKATTIALFNTATRLCLFIFGIGAVLIYQTPEAALAGMSVSGLLAYGIGIPLMWNSCRQGQDWHPTWFSMKKHVLLGLPLMIATCFGIIQTNIHKWTVSFLSSPEDYIVFALGASEIPLIYVLTGPITQVLLADSAKLFKDDRKQEVACLLWKAARTNTILLLPLMVFLFATAESLIRLLYTDKYIAAVEPFTLYLFMIPIRIMNFSSIEVASGKTHLPPIIFGTNVVLILSLTLYLYDSFGFMSPIYAGLLCNYLFAVPAHIYVFVRILQLPLRETFPSGDFLRIVLGIAVASMSLLVRDLLPTQDLFRILTLSVLFGTVLLINFRILDIQNPFFNLLRSRWK